MKDKLFTIIDGEPIVTAPLVNIPEYKKLWKEDTTDDKSMYKKWLLYIYKTYDYRSDMYELDNKEYLIKKEVFGKSNIRINKTVHDCINVYIQRNGVAEQSILEGAIRNAYSVNASLGELVNTSKQFENVIKALDKQIKDALSDDQILSAASMIEKRLDLQTKQLALVDKAASMTPKVEKSIDSIINIRQKVEKAISKLDDSRKLENFIIDEFITKREAGIYTINKYTKSDEKYINNQNKDSDTIQSDVISAEPDIEWDEEFEED